MKHSTVPSDPISGAARLRRRAMGLTAAALMLGVLAPSASAQQFPNRPIRLIATAAPGGGSDILARRLQKIIMEQGGHVVVVENIAGGSGSLGLNAAIKAQPDGYTIVIAVPDAVTIYPLTKKKPPYNVETDLTPLAQVVESSFVFAVSTKNRAVTMQDFVANAKSGNKPLNFATAGAASSTRFIMEVLKHETGINIEQIPYKGIAPAALSTAQGETDIVTASMTSFKPFVDGGQLKYLGVLRESRMPDFPALPTVAESGIANMAIPGWFGIFGPPKMPADIAARLGDIFIKAVNSDEFRAQAAALGLDPKPRNGAEFGRFIAKDTLMWKEIITRARVPLED